MYAQASGLLRVSGLTPDSVYGFGASNGHRSYARFGFQLWLADHPPDLVS
jgi:hypothetical protein